KIVGTRNYLSHRSIQSKDKAVFNLNDLSLLINLIQIFINLMILDEMEYSIDIINSEIYKKGCFYSLILEHENKRINWESIK
ncbi:MAG: hypothetical protein JW982_06385, partial [Spirochaetes bacterium]|nr:hypothetical protein [Spirochaetota bacterium]